MLNQGLENVYLQQQSLVGQVLDAIRRFSKKLAKDETGCTFKCNSVPLGAMFKQLPHKWLWPHRPKPSSNFSFAEINKTVLQLKIRFCQVLLFESRRIKMYLHSFNQHLNPKCSPNNYLFPEIARLEALCFGLSLET